QLPGFADESGRLAGAAADMRRIRRPRSIGSALGNRERLMAEPSRLVDAGPSQRDPRKTRQRFRRDGGIADAPADREGLIVARERAIVIASPERQEARLEQGLSARRVRAIRRRQSTIGPLGTFLQPLRRHPKRRERAREAERLVRPPFIDEPSERFEQFAVPLLDLERGGPAV